MSERAELIKRVREMRGKIKSILDDAEHWNTAHPNEPPIDADPDGQLGRIVAGIDKMLKAEIRSVKP